jgi:hypothetical protein
MAKRDIIMAEILKGGATQASLMEAAQVNEKGLASQFTYMRMMGKCPMKQPDGTFKIVSREEWDAYTESRGGVGSTKILTPAERLDRAAKRVTRAASALDSATKRLATTHNKLNQLQVEKCKIELQIAEILEGEAQTAVDEAPEEVSAEGDTELTDDEAEAAEGEDFL